MIVTARDRETVDAICWRALGRTDLVEQVLKLNPGLAEIGPLLPAGTKIVLPEPVRAVVPVRETVKLWD